MSGEIEMEMGKEKVLLYTLRMDLILLRQKQQQWLVDIVDG